MSTHKEARKEGLICAGHPKYQLAFGEKLTIFGKAHSLPSIGVSE
jgi:hypothetical protein